MRKLLTPEIREKILALYLQGHGVNHVVFLLNYEWDADDVNQAIRERLVHLQKAWQDLQTSYDHLVDEMHSSRR